MAASTGVIFSASITAQVEATVVAGVRSNLTPQAPATSRIPESESYDVAATPTRVTRRPDESADDLIF